MSSSFDSHVGDAIDNALTDYNLSDDAMRWTTEQHPVPTASTTRRCAACHERAPINSRATLCRVCSKARHQEAKLRGQRVRRHHLLAIAVRDENVCHLCRGTVDLRTAWPSPDYATLDHLVPISAGGTDERENLALAHWLCNVRRGVRDAP